jgi:hypothetical protein
VEAGERALKISNILEGREGWLAIWSRPTTDSAPSDSGQLRHDTAACYYASTPPIIFTFDLLMASSNASFSQIQDIFDAALKEYARKTGVDIATDPITASLRPCHTSDAVLAVLQEKAHAFDEYRNGDWKGRLMGRLKPVVEILVGLSDGVLSEGVSLVRSA